MRQTSITFNVKRGDVYLVHLGQGSGSEQAGTRPAVVIQNNIGNRYSSTTIVAAITSYKEREFMPTHVIVKPPFLNGPSIILLEQIFTLNKTKLVKYLGHFNNETMRQVDPDPFFFLNKQFSPFLLPAWAEQFLRT